MIVNVDQAFMKRMGILRFDPYTSPPADDRFWPWTRKQRVRRAVREGLRRAHVTAVQAERAIRLIGEEAAVMGHIRQAWRDGRG